MQVNDIVQVVQAGEKSSENVKKHTGRAGVVVKSGADTVVVKLDQTGAEDAAEVEFKPEELGFLGR